MFTHSNTNTANILTHLKSVLHRTGRRRRNIRLFSVTSLLSFRAWIQRQQQQQNYLLVAPDQLVDGRLVLPLLLLLLQCRAHYPLKQKPRFSVNHPQTTNSHDTRLWHLCRRAVADRVGMSTRPATAYIHISMKTHTHTIQTHIYIYRSGDLIYIMSSVS